MISHNALLRTGGDDLLADLWSDPMLAARRVIVAAGSTIHDAGGAADNVFLIQHGEVRQYQLSPDGSQRLLDILGSGQWFGAEALGRLSRYGCQARAITNTAVLIVGADKLLAALAHRPQASAEIIHQLAGRLSSATEEASRLTFDDCKQRLLKTLVRFSRSAAATAGPDGVTLRITHEQLAQAVGAARETISLTLTELRHANLLRTGRNRLSFNPQALTASLNFE